MYIYKNKIFKKKINMGEPKLPLVDVAVPSRGSGDPRRIPAYQLSTVY